MNLLFIGGTRFVGRHMAEEALNRGHKVTLFHRGQTGADLFAGNPNVIHVIGDRKEGLEALGDGPWDAVVDCVGYEPPTLQKTLSYVQGKADQYLFISTISVYEGVEGSDYDESGKVLDLPKGADLEQFTTETYGALKALCELEVMRAFPGKSLALRIGLQVGPLDVTDRFNDWIERIYKNDEVLIPVGTPMPWQLIDTRDTGIFALNLLESGASGVFNVSGPDDTTLNDAAELIRKIVNPKAEFVEIDEAWIAENGLEPWQELALWIPESERNGFAFVASVQKAVDHGLRCRPLEETIRDCFEYVKSLPADRTRRAGLTIEREHELLAKAKTPVA